MTIFPMTLIRSGGLPLAAWLPLANGLPDWGKLDAAAEQAASQCLQAFDLALARLPEGPIRTKVYNARKEFYQRRKVPSEALQQLFQSAPTLNTLHLSLGVWTATQAAKKEAEQMFEQHLLANYQYLQTITLGWDEMLRKSLVYASHDLLAGLRSFEAKQSEHFDKKDRRSALALVQYLSRAVFKTSPLGRFTQVEIKEINEFGQTHEAEEGWMGAKSMITPNVALLPAIYEVLLKIPAFYESLELGLNPALLINENRAEWLYFDGEVEAFQHIELDGVTTLVIEKMLDAGRRMPYRSLLNVLETEVEANREQLNGLVFQLIDMGVLAWNLPEKGLGPGWCNGLYQYLGYLPANTALTEAAYLLQWLRTAARVLPFQSVEAAQTHQKEAFDQLKQFLEKHGAAMPPIPLEQVFFEDMAKNAHFSLPDGALESLVNQLLECWKQNEYHPLSPFRQRLHQFAEHALIEGAQMDFLEFARQFMLHKRTELPSAAAPRQMRHKGKIGALLQVYQENGEVKAVVNAMYAGGGKMFARWLSLFPAIVSERLITWQKSSAPSVLEIPFPWQGWSNANFQPLFSSVSLSVPDGRVGHYTGGRAIVLGDLVVRRTQEGQLQLIEKQDNNQIRFVDLGLESPESRPPVIQLLWYLGTPMVSVDSMMPGKHKWEQREGYYFRPRLVFQSLVLERASWELLPEFLAALFPANPEVSQAEQIGRGMNRLKACGIPQRFFGQFSEIREKPQYYDMNSPVSMVLLQKNLLGKTGRFRIAEMLPLPEQWPGDRVGEFVVAFSTH